MPSEKAKEILNRYFDERKLFTITSNIRRGFGDDLVEVFKKFTDELKANNEVIDEESLKKRFEELGYRDLFNSKINELSKLLPKREAPGANELYSDLTERARSIFFKHLNDDNLKRYSEDANEGDSTVFKKVFINLIHELKEKNEKIKGSHIVNRMLEYGVNPEHWNDQLNSIKVMIEDLEGKKPEPFYDEELEKLALELSRTLPSEISEKKIEQSEEAQRIEVQYNRFIKMQLNLSTQLRSFENHVLKKALEQSGKEKRINEIEKIKSNLKEDERQKAGAELKDLNRLVEVEKSFNTFLQELATIDDVDHDRVSIIPVEGKIEGRKYTFPAIRVPFKVDFKTLKKYLIEGVYNSKQTPYFVNENENEFTVRNSFLEKELTADKNGLTFNLDIEPEKRLSRHAERLKLYKQLFQA